MGGRLHLWQPAQGYRAGIDPVLLAAACGAKPGQSVLDLGCGVGTAALCLAARVPNLALTGVEMQPDLAKLAARNAEDNGITLEVVTADLAALPTDLRQRQFDHVVMNPPYFRRDRGSTTPDPSREGGRGEATPLADWMDSAARRLRPKGHMLIIQRADRLADLLSALPTNLGSLKILPIAPRAGRPAKLILLRAQKDGRADTVLQAPLVLHSGDRHLRDGDDYTPVISSVLREAAALEVFGG